MRTRTILCAAALLSAGTLLGWLGASGRLDALAQDKKAAPPAAPTNGTPEVLPRPDFHFKGNVGRTYLESDPPQFPQPVQPPKGAPNVVVILLDDTGFGQYSTFGGGIPSPTIQKLADAGLRYNRFHTTAICSPTRAALITGRNHHTTTFGTIGEAATGYDGYTCVMPRSCGTAGEVLRQNGYVTAWIGKNHNTPTWEASAAGPFDRWAKVKLVVDFAYEGKPGERGRSATVTLSANGARIADGKFRGRSRCKSRSARAWTSARRWTSPTSCRSPSPARSRRSPSS